MDPARAIVEERLAALTAAAPRVFDESKVARFPKGTKVSGKVGGGRFAVKENAGGRFEVVNPEGKKVAETTEPADAQTIADEKNSLVVTVEGLSDAELEQNLATWGDAPESSARTDVLERIAAEKQRRMNPGPRDLFRWSARKTVEEGKRSASSGERVKAESAARVLDRIESGELEIPDAELGAALTRMLHVDPNGPDRSVLSMELEVIQGLAIKEQMKDGAASAEYLLAAAHPVNPPRSWFDDPNLPGPTPLTVTDDGRVYGHVAPWNVCHIAEPRGPGVCVTAPSSRTGYSLFHLGEIVTEEGDRLPVGQITLDAPHAAIHLNAAAAARHYDHTGTAAADVRCGEDEHGIWVAGAARPMDDERLRALRGAKVSGDWRNGELVGALAVNVPGFPIPRPEARMVASADGTVEQAALVAAGILSDDDCGCEPDARDVDRKVRVLAARMDGIEGLAALVAGAAPKRRRALDLLRR